MDFTPEFTISARLLQELEAIAELKARITGASPRRAARTAKNRAAHILAPLLKAKLVKRIGTRKFGRYLLA
jgi:hypothetical protein